MRDVYIPFTPEHKKGEEFMKKFLFSLVSIFLFIFVVSGVSWGWQGRMAGLEDPYGLVSDESDFLIHSAKIAKGSGVKFYGDYRFTYRDVTKWDYKLSALSNAGVLMNFYQYDTSGKEYKNDALLGVAFPLGTGRMGLFFTYDATRGSYNGHEDALMAANLYRYDLTGNLDNVAFRLIYGLPVGSFNLGGEAQLARHQAENENVIPGYRNYTLATILPMQNLTPFQLPYRSEYWEALLKGSLEGKAGPLDLAFTMRGGFLLGGNSSFELTQGSILVDFNGNVRGWRAGGDLWARYNLSDGLSLPFLLRVNYEKTSMEMTGLREIIIYSYPYENHIKTLHIEAGGGVDKKFGKGTMAAAGIYYNYFKGKYDLSFSEATTVIQQVWNHSDYPSSSEHRILMRLSGERELTPAIKLRAGLTPFFGWIREDYNFNSLALTDEISLDGYHWGVGAALGASIKLEPVTLEPFFNVGYQHLKLDGDGNRVGGGGIMNLWEMDKSRAEWYVGGGLSVLFGQ